jgi:uncharacterized protein (TIGR00369 family)
VPEGFVALQVGSGGFIGHNGPLYARRDADGHPVFGFRVQPIHCNPMGICHGGWLATMLDMTLPLTARLSGPESVFLLTVNLSIDYLNAVPLGAWVEGRAQVLRRTKRMVFIQGMLSVDGESTTRASGVFRVGPNAPDLQL